MKKLGLYVHIPFCRSKCGYCSFNSVSDLSFVDGYINRLIAEIEEKLNTFCDYAIDTVYFGGGTPSVLDVSQLAKVMTAIRHCGKLAKTAEISVECNPESVTRDKLKGYFDLGVNRISLGMQSTNDDILRSVGRAHTFSSVINALDIISAIYKNYSVDFMLSLPNQTKSDIDGLIKLVSDYDIKHVSAYALKLEEGTPLYGKIIVDEDRAVVLYDEVVSRLGALGLGRYEISNFAKVGYECRHNLKYWNYDEYLGVGVSAHSFMQSKRFYNIDNIAQYIAAADPCDGCESVNGKDAEFEYIMLGLRTERGIELEHYKYLFKKDFLVEYAESIENVRQFLTINDKRVVVKTDSFYIVNSLLINFL